MKKNFTGNRFGSWLALDLIEANILIKFSFPLWKRFGQIGFDSKISGRSWTCCLFSLKNIEWRPSTRESEEKTGNFILYDQFYYNKYQPFQPSESEALTHSKVPMAVCIGRLQNA